MILQHFIKNRVNTKLGDLRLPPIISDVDMNAVDRMKWFDHLSAGKQHTDFFANRVTNYSKGHMEWDESFNILIMDNNLVADYTQWERGKDYPEYMDEVALVYYFKRIFITRGNTPKGIQTSCSCSSNAFK
jgi:hypothetical protein